MTRQVPVLLLTAAALLAQTAIDPKLYQGMEWRNIGPFRGGRSVAVAGIAGNQQTYYFGGVGSGVWKTSDEGQTWQNISGTQLKTSSVGALAVAPSDPNVIYAGMGEHAVRGVALSHGDGVYRSSDAGRTWKHLGLEKTRAIARIVVHPKNPDHVYVAAQGAPFGPTKDRGIYRSKDGGATWQLILAGANDTTGCSELSIDPANPRILYAAFWDHLRKPWEVRSGGAGSSLYKTTDGGDTWDKINEGLPKVLGKMGVSVSANPDRIYAIVEADPGGGLYRSDDGGKKWTLQNSTWAIKTRSWYYMEVFADTKNPDVVWVLNAGIHKSIDGGKTFTPVPPPHGDTHDLWIDPANSNNLILADDGGAAVSHNGGATWSTQENQPTAQFYRVNTDNRFPYWVYGGQQDNTTVAIASRTPGPGIGWKDWFPVGGCESGYVTFNPDKPDRIYAGCYMGILSEFDANTRDSGEVSTWPALPAALPAREMKYRFNWNAPILVSRHDPKVIYHAAQVLLRSEDRGRTWKEISPDLTHPDDKTQGPGGGPITNEGAGGEIYDTIFYVAESPRDPSFLWTGTDDGLMQYTRDAGKTWTKLLLPGLPDAQINAVELSPHDANTVYIAATRYKFNDFTPYFFKSIDLGKTWEKISDGIPADAWAHVVREDPTRRGLLYAGTELGMFVSFDAGRKWQPLQLNLPLTPINDLQVHGDDLVAATSGRAFWILDDLAPLRQADAKTSASEVHLFQPQPAFRTNLNVPPGSNTRLGKNPPPGAIIDFWLAKEGKVTLEVLDSGDNVIRTLSTEKREGEKEPSLKVKAGMNRVAWNLQYDKLPEIPELRTFSIPDGRTAIPGSYRVRLTAAGQTKTEPLQVRPDPRVETTPEQYRQRDEFLSRMDADLTAMHQGVLRLRKVRAQVEDVVKRVPKLADPGKAYIEKLNTMEDALIQKRTVDMQTVINFPVRLSHYYTYLRSAVNGTEGAVTDGARRQYADLKRKWDDQKKDLDRLLQDDREAFNKAAQGQASWPVTSPAN